MWEGVSVLGAQKKATFLESSGGRAWVEDERRDGAPFGVSDGRFIKRGVRYAAPDGVGVGTRYIPAHGSRWLMVAGARPNRANYCGTSLSELGSFRSSVKFWHSQARGLRVAERVQDDAVGFDGRHGAGIVGLGRGARRGPRGNPASRAPGRLPLGCERRRCVQKSSGHSAGRRPEVRSLGVVNDASAAPNSRTAPTRRPSPPPHPPASCSSSGAPTRRPDTVMTHVASASFVLGPAHPGSTRILDETGARGRRRGHGLGPAIAAAAEGGARRSYRRRDICTSGTWRSTRGDDATPGSSALARGGFGAPTSRDSSEAAEAYPTPRSVSSLDGRDVTHVAGGARHSVAVTSAGEVYAFGDCSGEGKGASAHAAEEAVIDPPEVTATTNAMPRVATVACGQRHCAAVTTSGVLLSWGNEEFGQLGQGPPRDSSSKGDAKSLIRRRADASMMPRLVGSGHVKFTSVACGAGHTLALTANGRVFSFGRGAFGALGHGDRLNCDVPRLVDALWGVGVAQIAAGDNHSASLSASGRVYTWGRGKYGALGHRDVDNRSRPTPVQALDDAGVRCEQIACGGDHTLAIAGGGSGVLLAWGRGSSGPAGTGATADVLTPTIIDRALLGDESFPNIRGKQALRGGDRRWMRLHLGREDTGTARTRARRCGNLGHGVWKLSTGGGAAVSAVAKSRVFPPDATFCTPSQLETTRLRLWRLAERGSHDAWQSAVVWCSRMVTPSHRASSYSRACRVDHSS